VDPPRHRRPARHPPARRRVHPHPTTSPAEARARFNATLDESAQVIAAVSSDRLLTTIDPQPTGAWRHLTILEAIFKVVGHVEMHTGQIILLTKQLTASDLDLSMPRKR